VETIEIIKYPFIIKKKLFVYYTLYNSIMVYLVSYYVFAQFKLFDDYKNSRHIGFDNNLLTITFDDWIL